jgi:hypothetical protein
MPLRARVWVDNEAGRFVRVRASDGPWIALPFEPVVQSMELARMCLLLQQPDDGEHVLSAYAYDGTRLWRRALSELPIASVDGGVHLSTMQSPQGTRPRPRDELRLNRGPAYCVIEDATAPRFGPLVMRAR